MYTVRVLEIKPPLNQKNLQRKQQFPKKFLSSFLFNSSEVLHPQCEQLAEGSGWPIFKASSLPCFYQWQDQRSWGHTK